MRKLFLLLVSMLIVSCSTNDLPQQTKQESYTLQFKKAFPTVSLNQSWDFSEKSFTDESVLPEISFITRSIYEGSNVINKWDSFNGDPKTNIYNLDNVSTLNEFGWIKANVNNGITRYWDPYATNDFWVYYIHGNGSDMYFPSLGVHWINKGTEGANDTEYITQMPILGCATGDNWYYGSGAKGTGVRISGENYREGVTDFYWFATDDLNNFGEDKKLETYKELNTPYGATYYCFDCDKNGDFSDIICLTIPTIAAKRYMIEDLGSENGSDFDFNDIVVDVIDNGVKQIAKVRAMGGTLDFTIKIGNTTWTKSKHGFTPSVMYNTINPDYSLVLSEFEVTGWDNNNISITINGNNGSVWEIPFPKQGQAPMIVAMKPTVDWNIERQSVLSNWFSD